MKKSLLALAAMGAFAGVAQAQSSVTVYGILDLGFQGTNTRNGSTKTNATLFTGEGSESTSRLGFRGTEDLGGGTSAFFTAEFALAPTNYNLSGDTGGGLLNRQTFVGLAQKGIGRAAIGTQYTPVHLAVGRTDPGQQNNMAGNVIYATNTAQGEGQTTTAYTVRYYNALTFATDRVAGFVLSGIYNNNNSDTNQTANAGGSTNNNAWGVGLNYVWKKLNFDAAVQNSQSTNWAAQQTTGPALPAAAARANTVAPNPLGTAVNMQQQYFAASYDFGILTAYAQYVSNKVSVQANPDNYLSRTAQQIGVRGYITKTIEGWASGGTGRINANASQSFGIASLRATQNFTGYQVGTNYWLSKRTNAYAIFGSTQVSSSSVAVSEGRSSYGVGVRHTF